MGGLPGLDLASCLWYSSSAARHCLNDWAVLHSRIQRKEVELHLGGEAGPIVWGLDASLVDKCDKVYLMISLFDDILQSMFQRYTYRYAESAERFAMCICAFVHRVTL